MDERGDLPYKAEYAKSGRAGCKRCKDTIAKDSLRLAIMVQDRFAMKKVPQWFHFHCFWHDAQYHTVIVADIKGFNALRWEDQQKIKDMIAGGSEAVENLEVKGNYEEFSVEYAKSGRSVCRGCSGRTGAVRIAKDQLRISRLDYDSAGASMHGPQKWWYCLNCFVKMRRKLGFFEDMDPAKIPGFEDLKTDDQHLIVKSAKKGAIKRTADDNPIEGTSDSKKSKKDEPEQEKKLREQNEMLWKYRDTLKRTISVDVMKKLLEDNDQVVPKKKRNILDLLSDCMVFGAFGPCENCEGTNYLFCEAESHYMCVGLGQDGKPCDIKTSQPTREEFKIPEDCQEADFLKNYKYVARERVYPETSVNLTPLTGLSFVVGNKTYALKEVIASQLASMGAKVVHNPRLGLSACISSKDEFESKNSRIIRACKALRIPIISESYLHACKNGDASAIIKAHTFTTDE